MDHGGQPGEVLSARQRVGQIVSGHERHPVETVAGGQPLAGQRNDLGPIEQRDVQPGNRLQECQRVGAGGAPQIEQALCAGGSDRRDHSRSQRAGDRVHRLNECPRVIRTGARCAAGHPGGQRRPAVPQDGRVPHAGQNRGGTARGELLPNRWLAAIDSVLFRQQFHRHEGIEHHGKRPGLPGTGFRQRRGRPRMAAEFGEQVELRRREEHARLHKGAGQAHHGISTGGNRGFRNSHGR